MRDVRGHVSRAVIAPLATLALCHPACQVEKGAEAYLSDILGINVVALLLMDRIPDVGAVPVLRSPRRTTVRLALMKIRQIKQAGPG